MRPAAATGSLAGRTVLVRADLSKGITPDLVETADRLAREGAKVAVIAGHGRPVGEYNPTLSLRPFVAQLSRALGKQVHFIVDCVGVDAEAGLAALLAGEVALLENLRFHNDARRATRTFAIRLSALADHFVVTGHLSSHPALWITELRALLPEPHVSISQLEREAS